MISKMLAAQKKGLNIPIKKRDIVLYLGASHGVTAKIMSKIVGNKGFIFCLDVSPRTMVELVKTCEEYENMAPLLYDANKPELYKKYVTKVDVVYQDIAQKNQVSILKKNVDMFLKEYGYIVLILKTKSISSTKSKEEVKSQVLEELKEFVELVDHISLDPYHKEHYIIVGRKNKQ